MIFHGSSFSPDIGGMSDIDSDAVRESVRARGAIIATGMTSLFNEDGEPRSDFALSDVLGVHLVGEVPSRCYLVDADTDNGLTIEAGEFATAGLAL
jgi:hypothetical protein